MYTTNFTLICVMSAIPYLHCMCSLKHNIHTYFYIYVILILLSLFSLFCPFVAFSSAGVPTYPAVPWNDFYMQGGPFSNQFCSRMLSSSTAGHYFTEQISYAQPSCLPSSPCFQVPNGTTLGSMPHAEKQKAATPPDQSSYQNHQTEPEMTSLPEREEVESSSKKEETAVGN